MYKKTRSYGSHRQLKRIETLRVATRSSLGGFLGCSGDGDMSPRFGSDIMIDRDSTLSQLPGLESQRFSTILADPPWQFKNRTGKVAPEHKRLKRYETMSLQKICEMPAREHAADQAHLYLWVPNALLPEGLQVMQAWGFKYKSNIVWHKIRKDGGPDGRGVGFYFRNVTELLLFGIRGKMRTLQPGRTQVNFLKTRKEEHSKKPQEVYRIIEACSPGPFLELFARERIHGWTQWGDEVDTYLERRPIYKAYNGHSSGLAEHQRRLWKVIPVALRPDADQK